MILTALSQYGQKEIVGVQHNDSIVKYAKEAGFAWVNDDETPWCSIFMNWIAMKTGYERTNKANAKSWLEIGIPVSTPETGDVVVFSRGANTAQGHVGLFIAKRYGLVYVLGGNQGDAVSITPYKESDVIGYRKLNRAK